MVDGRVDHVVVAQARAAEERHRCADRRVLVEDRGGGVPVDVPPGERLRAGLHVGLGHVVDADREQLLELAGVVLVRVDRFRRVAVEVDEHRRVDGHLEGHRAEVAQGLRAQELVLVPHHLPAADLVDAGREVAVPEPDHLLVEPGGRVPHPPQPPGRRPLAVAFVEDGIGGERRRGGTEDAVEGGRESAGVQGLDLSREGPETRPAQQVGDCRPIVPHDRRDIGAEGAKS